MISEQPAQPIATMQKSIADRRAIMVAFDGAGAETTEQIDLLMQQRINRFGQLRCIFIDTSQQASTSDGATIITDFGQRFVAQPQTQGYYTVFVPYVSKLTISSNDKVDLVLFDFDLPPMIWGKGETQNIPDPLPVTIDGQPIGTNATVQNWPAVQPVSISGQPISTNATVQNWPNNTDTFIADFFSGGPTSYNYPLGFDVVEIVIVTLWNNYTNANTVQLSCSAISFTVPMLTNANQTFLQISNLGFNVIGGSISVNILPSQGVMRVLSIGH